MIESIQVAAARPVDGQGATRSPRLVLTAFICGWLLLIGYSIPAVEIAPIAGETQDDLEAPAPGPTLQLGDGRDAAADNPISDFMYFVALVSPEPVSVAQSPGNTQRTRMLSATRRFTASSFLVTCEFAFTGEGSQRSNFDHTDKIRRHERQLKAGGLLDHQLGSINVEGPGAIGIDVEGTMTGGVTNVTEVRLRFNGRGRLSPVTIDLHDIRYAGGTFRAFNETVARVNTLSFRKQPGPPKMDITVASVRRKDASDTSWEHLVGKVKATAVNLVLEPIAVEPAGYQAMLKFGVALASAAPAFTFPHARNLRP